MEKLSAAKAAKVVNMAKFRFPEIMRWMSGKLQEGLKFDRDVGCPLPPIQEDQKEEICQLQGLGIVREINTQKWIDPQVLIWLKANPMPTRTPAPPPSSRRNLQSVRL